MKFHTRSLFCALVLLASGVDLFAQGTIFTYQGRLSSGGSGINGVYDFHLVLYDVPTGGSPLRQQSVLGVGVTNGLFTLPLDFGLNAFKDGAVRWLDVATKTNGSASPYVPMTPRQQLTPAPYAIVAGNVVSGAISNAQLTANAVGQPNLIVSGTPGNGKFLASDGSGLIWQDASAVTGAWLLNGNSGTSAGAQFIGTTDLQPLEFKVANQRALRLEMNASGAPNVIGGAPVNSAANGTLSATIGGGGATGSYTNIVTANLGTVSGGGQNTAGGTAATVAGGLFNKASGDFSFVGGGGDSTIAGGNQATGSMSVVAGGAANRAFSTFATVVGGYQNTAHGQGDTIGGGSQNTASNSLATIGGGGGNVAGNYGATVGGGLLNVASGYAAFVGGGGADGFAAASNTASGGGSVVVGGVGNVASAGSATVGGGAQNTASGNYATVPGGGLNVASGTASFAAGLYARATNNGAFVWSDNHNLEFNSTADNQFLIRSTGGVGINLNNPQATLDISGTMRLNAGTTFTNLCAGQAVMTTGSPTSVTNLSITFPRSFYALPKVVATVAADPAWDVSDTFVVSVRKVTTTNCVVNIVRVDSASGWSQNLRVNWMAWE